MFLDFKKNWLYRIFLNLSYSALHYNKVFYKIKNGGNQAIFKVKCV